MAVAGIAFTSCKKDEIVSEELGTATINGTIRADIDQTNDMNDQGVYEAYYSPEGVEGMTVKVEINSADLVQNPEAGYDYDKKVYTATTNASGDFTLELPATDEGFTATIVFEDKYGVTRTLYTTDGSSVTEESYVHRADANKYIYAGANIDVVYDANISPVNGGANQHGMATIYGSVYGEYNVGTTYSGDITDYPMGSASPYPGKEIRVTWDYAPYNTGYNSELSFVIDANGDYIAEIPTEVVGGNNVSLWLGSQDFLGTCTYVNMAGTADSTWDASYSLGGLQANYYVVGQGDILVNQDFVFSVSLIP